MKMFEDKEFNGPLKDFLDSCKPHRVESIYNKEYKYIKEIIWDEEKNNKYGNTRKGYDSYKQEIEGTASYSGEIELRVTKKDGQIVGYFTETKLSSNEHLNLIFVQYQLALEKTKEILKVKDKNSFMYWLTNERPPFGGFKMGTNEIVGAIQNLESIIRDYNEDEEFKRYLDKIKD